MLGILVKTEIMEEWLIQWEKAENLCKFAICFRVKRKKMKNIAGYVHLWVIQTSNTPSSHTHALTLLL